MKLKRFLSIILVTLLTGTALVPVWASAAPENTSAGIILDLLPDTNDLGITINNAEFSDLKNISIKFATVYDSTATFDFPYSDEFFFQPDNSYSHTFAKGSLGLAVASFRSKLVNKGGYADLAAYFTSIGFGNISAEAYKTEPTANSVTYAIASKQIGDQTVIAAVCCGAGYGAEWSSNLTVGSGERHEGFGNSAEVVKSAISEYINSNGITGKISLWTTGYSRAAAIANLVAADMTDSGMFQHVYCYTFATPRTVIDHRQYSNIFNVIGKNDPVPQIPFADWGYTRYGTDLYLPAVQLDSDYANKADAVSEILYKIDGHHLMYNPEICSQFRTFFDYLCTLLSSAEEYSNELQPGVLQVMANSNSNNILQLVSKIIATFSPKTKEDEEEIAELIDYIQQLVNQYVLRGNSEQIAAGMWDPDLNVTQNLTNEHDPDKYIAWMFLSNDPEYIFGQNTQFRQFTIKGDVKIYIYDEYGYIETINQDGKISYEGYDDSVRGGFMPDPYIQTGNGQVNITLPADENYVMDIESDSDQTITYYATTHSVNSVRADISDIYTLKVSPGNRYYLYSGSDGGRWVDEINANAKVSDALSGSVLYSPSVILRLQNINFLHLTLQEIAILIGFLVLFSYTELIICATLALVRLIQRTQRRSLPTILMHFINAAIFLGVEIVMWYFIPAFPIAKLAAKIISFIFILSLAVVALTEHPSKKNIIITLGIFVLMVLSCIFENWLIPKVNLTTVSIKIIFYALMSAAAAFTWTGHNRRRALKAAEIEKQRYEKKLAKAEKDMQKAYDKAERETQKYLAKQEKKLTRKRKTD